jgi:hypothetical protein
LARGTKDFRLAGAYGRSFTPGGLAEQPEDQPRR